MDAPQFIPMVERSVTAYDGFCASVGITETSYWLFPAQRSCAGFVHPLE